MARRDDQGCGEAMAEQTCDVATDVAFCCGCRNVPLPVRAIVLCLIIAGFMTLFGNILLLRTVRLHYQKHLEEFEDDEYTTLVDVRTNSLTGNLHQSVLVNQFAAASGTLPVAARLKEKLRPARTTYKAPAIPQSIHALRQQLWANPAGDACGQHFANGFSQRVDWCSDTITADNGRACTHVVWMSHTHKIALTRTSVYHIH